MAIYNTLKFILRKVTQRSHAPGAAAVRRVRLRRVQRVQQVEVQRLLQVQLQLRRLGRLQQRVHGAQAEVQVQRLPVWLVDSLFRKGKSSLIIAHLYFLV